MGRKRLGVAQLSATVANPSSSLAPAQIIHRRIDAYGKRVFDGLLEGALSVDWPAGWYTVCVKGQARDDETRRPSVVR